ncbi:MAG: MotA/TolQ/ExbB proton channel family protein [Bacteroidales bacterium]|nr:MotA/TolQ/ExbB proton channel family protein [Bacteroidales bacterium]
MKKLIAFISIAAMMAFGLSNAVYAQDAAANGSTTVQTDSSTVAKDSTAADTTAAAATPAATPAKGKTFHQVLKEKFIQGGPGFMGIILLTLIFGLAIAIERVIYLSMASINSKKLLREVEEALGKGDVQAAKEICKNTRGPVASIFAEGLNRYDNGLEDVEKSIIAYGSVVTGRLENGVSWISLFIALAPMLGFMGTVIGMIQAFDDIAAAGDISPAVVATGIKVALLTTVFGLIVAVILQVFYNYIISKIDTLVSDMEDTSISFLDLVAQHYKK